MYTFIIMKHFALIVLLLVTLVYGGDFKNPKELSVKEALTHVNRLPKALQNVVSRATLKMQLINLMSFSTDTGNRREVVGGEETTIEDNPYQISLRISVRSGSSSRTFGGIIHSIHYYHIHEEYLASDYIRDAATIRVRLPFSPLSPRTIIPLADSEWVNGSAIITGWGKNSQGKVPDILTRLVIPIVDRTTCNSESEWNGLITQDMICAGGTGSDSCDGDSGGPAVQNGIQYGIVSWGGSTCGSGLPGVYTNIAHPAIRGFIKRTTMV